MENFKITNYERDHGKGTFPAFRHLSHLEAAGVRQAITKSFYLPSDVNLLNLTKLIQKHSIPVNEISADAECDRFNLSELIRALHLKLPANVYINWYRYDNIDEMAMCDFVKYFHEIWYPGSDDLEIIEPSMAWILLVHHSGSISYLTPQTV